MISEFADKMTCEEFEHNHSLIETANPSHYAPPQSPPIQEEEFQELLQLKIYEWIHAEVPSWQPENSPRYRHDSQALSAPIPGNEKAPAGLVYFKSVFDPYWTDEDLVRLQGSIYAWILMILNPCERFYEFEEQLKKLGSRLPALLIWRPGTPSKEELENLRSLLFEKSAQDVGEESSPDKINRKVHAILAELYIERGRLLGSAAPQVIRESINNRSISRYISASLSRLPLQKTDSGVPDGQPQAKVLQSRRATHWAALLTGEMGLETGSVAQAEERLKKWWTLSIGSLSEKMPTFPEVFRTTRFWNEIRQIEGPLSELRSVFHNLDSGAYSMLDAMDLTGRNFAWDRDRLQKWRTKLEGLEGLILWLSPFMHAREYLCTALPLDREHPDHLRESLLQSIREPSRFLEAVVRGQFEAHFLEFKKCYVECYCTLHEDALHSVRNPERDETKIDTVSLRNLDLLSGLQYMDKSYLNRVKIMARWMQRNQCNLPLRQILEHYPRCYCNFNPRSNRQPAGSYAQINGTIQEGTEYFRSILRRCGYLIMDELKTQQVGDSILKPITAALSDGPMAPLKPQCIELLNKIIVKYPSQFLAEIRKGGKPRRQTG